VEITLPIHRRKSFPERDPTLGSMSSSALRGIFVRGAQRRPSASTTAPIHRSRAEWSVRRGETFSRSGLSTSRALQAISGPSRATLRSCTLDPSRVYSVRWTTFGPLAQLVEQLTLNQRVGGSSPSRPTTENCSKTRTRKTGRKAISGRSRILTAVSATISRKIFARALASAIVEALLPSPPVTGRRTVGQMTENGIREFG
jgi:hypothetical protein